MLTSKLLAFDFCGGNSPLWNSQCIKARGLPYIAIGTVFPRSPQKCLPHIRAPLHRYHVSKADRQTLFLGQLCGVHFDKLNTFSWPDPAIRMSRSKAAIATTYPGPGKR